MCTFCVWLCIFFFFSSRRRHTRFDCDWSSDVCSSDLDQRSIPVPFPPYSVTTSNARLAPQYGTSIEGGLYHRASLGGVGGAAARLTATLSVYQMDMKDELDFDVQSLRYVNIGRSRHRGIEAGVTLSGLGAAS